MSSLRDFLAWFEGFSEFLDGPPNEAQWERLKAKVADLRASPAEDVAAAPARRAVEKPRTLTIKAWREAFEQAMLGEGIDPETTWGAWGDKTIDPTQDVAAVAKKLATEILSGAH